MSNARSRLPAFGRTPKELLRNPSIGPAAKAVYAMIDEVAGHEDITIERLADWLGVNVKTARKHLHAIRDSGWVEVVEVVTGSGRKPSEYIANAYPFQGLSEASEEVSRTNSPDQAERAEALPLSSTPPEKSGTPPSQKVPQGAGSGANRSDAPSQPSQKVVGPGPSQKVVGPTYLRDDETPPPTSPRSIPDDKGFSEFWASYPPTEWKQKTSKTNLRGFWFSLSDSQRALALQALAAYRASEQWIDRPESIPGPKIWLENEPWLEAQAGNLPRAKPEPRRYLTPEEVRLED